MSKYYINGNPISGDSYIYNRFYMPSTPISEEDLDKKRAYDRYVYGKRINSTKKTTKENDDTVSNPNINLIVSSDIAKARAWRGYNS